VRRVAGKYIDRLLFADRDRCLLIWSQLLRDRDTEVKRAAEATLAAHALPTQQHPRLTRDELFSLILLATHHDELDRSDARGV